MNATTDVGTGMDREPEDLERQADAIRADMDQTLSALERKFSPEQLLDRSLGYLRDHGSELTQTIGAAMKRNPIPVVMTLAGVTWLIASTYNARQPPGQDLSSRFARSGVGQKLQQRASEARERLHSTAASARERFGSSGGEGGGRFSGAFSSARETARMRAQQAQQRVYTMMDGQPLVLGALAVAVGAIIGAALPSTQYENRAIGRVRDRALTKAREVGEHQYDNLRQSLQGGQSAGGASQELSGGTQSGGSQTGGGSEYAGRA